MRQLAGTDIIDFHTSGYDLLVLTADGEFTHLDYRDIAESSYDDGRATAYDYCRTGDGDEVQVLLERSGITGGDWFPDALDDAGDLIPAVADEMAAIITTDGIIPSRALKARAAGETWEKKAKEADAAAIARARAVCEVVTFLGDNQSAAARVLGLHQSTVSRLVRKANAA